MLFPRNFKFPEALQGHTINVDISQFSNISEIIQAGIFCMVFATGNVILLHLTWTEMQEGTHTLT